MTNSANQENCSKIWHVLEPCIKASSQIIKTGTQQAPYRCLGSDEAVSYWYKQFLGADSGKPFWISKRKYLAAVCLAVPENYVGMAHAVELKYVTPSGTGCHYWYGDGTLKNDGWEEKIAVHQKFVKITGVEYEISTFVIQVDISSVYDRLKDLLAPI